MIIELEFKTRPNVFFCQDVQALRLSIATMMQDYIEEHCK